jgi:hypothetical protein
VCGLVVCGILLGPEGTSAAVRGCGWGCVSSGRACWLIRPDPGSGLLVVGVWWVFRVLFEMCIVDASIFVVKLLRADGGCLGTRGR